MSFDCVHDIRGNSYCGQKLDVIGEIRLYDCVYDVHKSIRDISMYRTPLNAMDSASYAQRKDTRHSILSGRMEAASEDSRA